MRRGGGKGSGESHAAIARIFTHTKHACPHIHVHTHTPLPVCACVTGAVCVCVGLVCSSTGAM